MDFGPEGVAPGPEPEAPYIDFGSLVSEENKGKSGTIYLRFIDDGRSTTTLVVGGSEQCDVKLEGDDIGEYLSEHVPIRFRNSSIEMIN